MSQEATRIIIKYFVLFGFFVVIPLVVFMSKKPKQKKMGWKNSESNRTTAPKGPIPIKTNSLEKPINEYINCFFSYNGKKYDAYEVLGLPAGSSQESVLSAYQAKVSQTQNNELLKAAFSALQSQS